MPAAAFAPSSFLPAHALRPRAAPARAPLAVSPARVPIRAARAPPVNPAAISPDDQAELEENRRLYTYGSPDTLPGVSFISTSYGDLPGQTPSAWWFLRAAAVGARVIFNFSKWSPFALFDTIGLYIDLLKTNLSKKDGILKVVNSFDKKTNTSVVAKKINERWAEGSRVKGTQFEETSPTLAPYRDMFQTLDLPPIANYFVEDKVFSRLRVAGYNPLSLARIFKTSDLPFAITDEDLPAPGDTIAAAIAEKRLYYQDFSTLSSVKQEPNTNKRFYVAKSLFAIPPSGGDLVPVAIEVDGDVVLPPKPGFTPNTRWAIAKLAINNCDAIHHELISHLGRTHLLLEPFVAATMRQLPSRHPVHRLLKPHFEGTVFINEAATGVLVGPGGSIDRIFAGDIKSVMQWCGGIVLNTKFNQSMPDVEMKTRGVLDPILDMPYREDALEHFDAMYEWVSAYLSHYYTSDAQVANDRGLQKWAAELISQDCGKLKDFGEDGNGRLTTVRYLARAVTFVIFSASVQHAAVNFPQLTLMGYPPATPGGLWDTPPKANETADMSKWQSVLTPVQSAMESVKTLGLIGSVYYTQLGQYSRGQLPSDRPIKDALQKYQARLQKIDKRIAAREAGSRLKYDYLRPGNVPQSINI